MPLFLRGVASVLKTGDVALEEFDSHACPRIELTAADLDWDPSSTVFEDQENYTLDYNGDLVRPGVPKRAPLVLINSVTTSTSAETTVCLGSTNNLCLCRRLKHVNRCKPLQNDLKSCQRHRHDLSV